MENKQKVNFDITQVFIQPLTLEQTGESMKLGQWLSPKNMVNVNDG